MATPEPSAATLASAVTARYDGLAAACCTGSLSCGAALDLAEPAPGERLVDLGCGSGRDVIRAAGRIGSAGQAIGLDRSEAMLTRARAATPPIFPNVRFVRSDLERLELPDASADVVISNCTINHAPDKEAVFREIHRVLRPGGRLVVSDVIAEETLPDSVRSDPAAWAACYGGAIPEADYRGAIERAGFPPPEILERSEPYDKGGVRVRSLTFRAFRPVSDPERERGASKP